RQAGALLVQAAHAEPEAGSDTPAALAAELARMAAWLGLERVEAAAKGDLAGRLQAALGAPAI
ncbi:MAG TPA: winged helix-turn-helix domain-containing protein, partial [Caulobacter sp.]|nr:winged helix-turn-helix domain-containing protein [Caulobacter sp.]